MKNFHKKLDKGEEIFVGLDIHKKRWHMTIRTTDVELFNASIPGKWDALKTHLEKIKNHPIKAVCLFQ